MLIQGALTAFPPFELALGRGAGEGQLAVARRIEALPDDSIVFVMGAYPDP